MSTDFPQFYGAACLLDQPRRDLYQLAPSPVLTRIPAASAKPFTHLAYEYELMRPFARMSFSGAFLTFALINVGVLILIYRLLRSELQPFGSAAPWVFLGFVPLTQAISFGQDVLILALFVVLAFHLLGKPMLAGVALGLAAFRFHDLLGLLLLFAIWRVWQFVAGFAIGAGCCFLASAAVVGWRAQVFDYLRIVQTMNLGEPVMPSLRGICAAISEPQLTPFLISAVLGIVAYVGWKRPSRERFLLALTASLLSSYHLYLYELSVLALPVLVLLARSFEEDRKRDFVFGALAYVAPMLFILTLGSRGAFMIALAFLPLTVARYFDSGLSSAPLQSKLVRGYQPTLQDSGVK